MAVRVVCRTCGKRLKLPEGGTQQRSAKCPKCLTRVDLTAALEASVYLPAISAPEAETERNAKKATVKSPASLPVPPPPKAIPPGQLAPPLAKPSPPPAPATAKASGGLRPPLAKSVALSLDDEAPLSLDDDPAPDGGHPAETPPFRIPVRVLADSLRQVVGPCFAVFVPHGMFLEVEPLKPFLYIPVGCAADAPAPGELTVTLPDKRAITLRVEARYARPLSRDAIAFLVGERPVPIAADYRRKWWLLWLAVIFALGLASGPLVLSQTANVGLEFGLMVGGVFAIVGLLANAAVVLFSRWSVFGQVAVMGVLCVLVSGVFFFGATAYLAGRQKAIEQAQTPPPVVEPPTTPNPPAPLPPEPGPPRAPSHVDKAYTNGVSALEDGPSEVTALSIAADGNHLAIGYADGTTRVWPLEQPTFDAMLPGPKADGPVTRVQFDSTSKFLFVTSATGVIAVPRNGSPAAPAKVNGTFVAVAPELSSNRVRFAAVRGNLVAHRFVATTFVLNPPKAKGFAVVGLKDEVTPAANGPDPGKPNGPTFLAWTGADRLLAGAPDGAVTVWSPLMKLEMVNRDHKAPVKAWAPCTGTGNFATGDDKGMVVIWPYKSGKPTAEAVFTVPVTGLAFSPSGAWLAVTDNTGWLAIVDVATAKVLQRKKLAAPIKALAFGPNDDAMILGNGKTVEVWHLPELMK